LWIKRIQHIEALEQLLQAFQKPGDNFDRILKSCKKKMDTGRFLFVVDYSFLTCVASERNEPDCFVPLGGTVPETFFLLGEYVETPLDSTYSRQ
jgi:hypothetical protein